MNQKVIPEIIVGAPIDMWEYVQSIQDRPFIYIMSNGYFREEVSQLFMMLSKFQLDTKRFKSFVQSNLQEASPNKDWLSGKSAIRFGTSKPLYQDENVTRFFGNFKNYSYVFRIDTNDKAFIEKMTKAIKFNVANIHEDKDVSHVKLRSDLAADGYEVPAFARVVAPDDGEDEVYLSELDLMGAIEIEGCDDDTKPEYNFVYIQLTDGRKLYMRSIDLDWVM